MRSTLLLGVLTAGLALALPVELTAHGGQYRGPEDVVPPNPGGRGVPTPRGPAGPKDSPVAPPAPVTPRGDPRQPGTGGTPGLPGAPTPLSPVTGGGEIPDDLSRWAYWWEFNKDPFIKLRAAVSDPGEITRDSATAYFGAGHRVFTKNTLRPTRTEILERVLPALARALEGTTQKDIQSSCMVAMAKIGEDSESVQMLPMFIAHLRENEQEVRETAAIALGISQRLEAVATLVELAMDTPAGRRLCDRAEVDDRTRSFAAYGLGLVGHATSDMAIKRQALDALTSILENDRIADRNIRVAAVHGIGLLRPDASHADGRDLFVACNDALQAFWSKPFGPGEQQIQAHVPTSVAKLFEADQEPDGDRARQLADWRRGWLGQVTGETRVVRESDLITQSAIIALGRTAARGDRDGRLSDLDTEVSMALQRYYERGRNHQARYFALMALGEIGGEANRIWLLKALNKGQKVLEKPWAAMALGVLVYRGHEARGSDAADPGVGRALLDELERAAAPDTRAALAIALGLARHRDAADALRELLMDTTHQDQLAGYLCVALALMGDERSTPTIRGIVAKSVRRPVLLQQAAIALGKLGDKQAAELLVRLMTEGDQNLAKMSAIASALGFIGDRSSVDTLIRMLQDEGLTMIARAFAAVALGGVADKEMLPWNSKIGANSNYRAAVETLTNGASGILDIL